VLFDPEQALEMKSPTLHLLHAVQTPEGFKKKLFAQVAQLTATPPLQLATRQFWGGGQLDMSLQTGELDVPVPEQGVTITWPEGQEEQGEQAALVEPEQAVEMYSPIIQVLHAVQMLV